jgi:hypothetical protein
MSSAAGRMLLGCFLALPGFSLMTACIQPPSPSWQQFYGALVSAVVAGIGSGMIYLYVRNSLRDPRQVILVDSAHASGGVFTLALEYVFLGVALPGPFGFIGIAVMVFGYVYCLLRSR